MLGHFRSQGGIQARAEVKAIKLQSSFVVSVRDDTSVSTINPEKIVNAAGPFAGYVANMLGASLPVHNVQQQKIAFEDSACVIPRNPPFSIDIDRTELDRSQEEQELMGGEPSLNRFLGEMPGGIQCRPEGGENSQWIKLGWADHTSQTTASRRSGT